MMTPEMTQVAMSARGRVEGQVPPRPAPLPGPEDNPPVNGPGDTGGPSKRSRFAKFAQ